MSTSESTTITKTGVTAPPQPGRWVADPSHSTIAASTRHLMITKVRGRFDSFSATVDVADDPTRSTVDVSIDAKSINTNDAGRDGHLRSPDFLAVDEHPQLAFTSTGIEHVEDDRYRLTGDLTIRGVTKPVVLDVDYFGITPDPWGSQRALFRATTQLERENWDITWNVALETGGVLVGKKLDVEIELQLVPEQPAS
ncbi:MAG: YceI family protein [Nitriliruptorales bacterium]